MNELLCASLGSCGAVLVSHPFELIKVRLQLFNELGVIKVKQPSFYRCLINVYVNEGVTGLYKGNLD